MKQFLIFLILIINCSLVQSQVKVTSKYGSDLNDLQDVLGFENIFTEKLTFQSETLRGKSYTIGLEEFTDGKLIKSTVLFDGNEDDYLKIKTEKLALKFLFKLADGKLKTQINGNGFSSKKSYFKLSSDEDQYALKDFFGSKEEIIIDINKKNAVFAILTPTIHKDGSGSYCEVAQSDIAPEKLGDKFKIPHYFLVTIKFN